MIKYLKIFAVMVVAIVVIVLGVLYVSFNFYSPQDPEVQIDNTSVDYFQNSYVESRAAFQYHGIKLSEKLKNVELFKRQVPSRIDDDLTIDFCYVPAQKKTDKLLIISSGIHGVEGYVGSAVQQMFMNEVLKEDMLDELGVLFVHGINPYGFKYTRRVTENNVDLNRNCDTEKTLFSADNEGYNDLYSMLNPTGEANTSSLKDRFFMVAAINKLLRASMQSLRQAVLLGQYEHEKGLYYGGNDFEPQLSILEDVFRPIARDYEMIFNIDLHTGYGERGTAHLFPNPIDDENIKSLLEKVFEGYEINWGDTDDFYVISGSFTDYIGKLLSDKTYLPMMLEYGTLNSQSTVGSVKSIHNMVLENQGVQFGYKTSKDSLKIKKSFMEMYNPSSKKWRTKIMTDSKQILEEAMVNYSNL